MIKPTKIKILEKMVVGKKYRPHQFKSVKIRTGGIAAHLNKLDDEGLVERILENGLIYWRRIK